MQCLDKEYLQQTKAILNCTPPYVTNDKQYWCKENLNLKYKGKNEVVSYIWKFINKLIKADSCPIPCKSTRYLLLLTANMHFWIFL